MSVLGLEVGTDIGDRVQERVHIVRGVVKVRTGARRRRQPEPAVQRLGAVVADPHGDAPAVQELADVVRVDAGDVECRQADPLLPGRRGPAPGCRGWTPSRRTRRWPSSASQAWMRSIPVSLR